MYRKLDPDKVIMHLVGTTVHQTHRFSVPGHERELVFVRSFKTNEAGEYDVVTNKETVAVLKEYHGSLKQRRPHHGG